MPHAPAALGLLGFEIKFIIKKWINCMEIICIKNSYFKL